MDAACIRVRGQVQGVGFRPFIWQLAQAHGITGEVLNDAEGVLIRARGAALAAFEADIRAKAPPLAQVDAVLRVPGDVPERAGFEIVASGAAGAETRVTPDAATCAACREEIFSPGRRAGYAFTNCTHCGPRFTILNSLPYDRAKTTMAPFEMCADCAAEYADPGDRRFHAQPVACPVCGPEVWFEGPDGHQRAPLSTGADASAPMAAGAGKTAPMTAGAGTAAPMAAGAGTVATTPSGEPASGSVGAAPTRPEALATGATGATASGLSGSGSLANGVIAAAAEALAAGQILAVKGLGGFHLCCDATNAEAVATLRARKRRPSKPLALMARREEIVAHAAPTEAALALLADAAAPIVLLPKREAEPAGPADGLPADRADGVPEDLPENPPENPAESPSENPTEHQLGELPDALAPGQAHLGWMLPYTPLHHLLLEAVRRPLVMTSGNLSGEPQVIGNAEAREKLGRFVDGFVMHNRDIARRLDDSVERVTAHGPMVLRRARGRVPGTLPLPPGFDAAPQVVAYGGQMKSAICLIKNGAALLSHHLGELDEALTYEAFLQADADYAALFDHAPEAVAVDLHPEFRATRHGQHRAEALQAPLWEIQHHHAHLAACLAENGWPRDGGAVAGIVLDGLGLGADGTIWGGEILLGDYAGYTRRAWLRPAPLVGGDAASRDPWRNAVMRLDAAGLADWAQEVFPDQPLTVLRQAAAAGFNAPLSSSAGRLFDAVAACLGLCPDAQSYEGEAAMRLEAMATAAASAGYAFGIGSAGEIDPAPMFRALQADMATGVAPGIVSARFHAGLAQAFAGQARALVASGAAQAVALSGGCFQNARLLSETLAALGDTPVLIHTKVPANDGGLALGQAVIAAARMESG